jgi:hypothetical protein
MDDILMIPVTYKNEELEFEASIRKYGYIHRLEVNVNGTPVVFEPDEENNYRALLNHDSPEIVEFSIDSGLLQAISLVLNSL